MSLFRDSWVKNRMEAVAKPVCHVASVLCLSSHPQGFHQDKHTVARTLLSLTADPSPLPPWPWLMCFFLENCSFLSHLPMSKQLITTSRLHRFRNEEWMMMAMVMLKFSRLVVSDSVTSWTAAHQAPLSSTVFWSLLRFMSTEAVKLPHLSHPLWLPSPLAFNLSQHQVLFQWVSTSRQVVNFLMNSQGWFPLGLTGFIFLLSKGLPRRFSSTTVRKTSIPWHLAFFMVQF